MELTMRQLSALLKVINKAELVQFYNNLLSYGSIHGAKLPSLTEFLSTQLKDSSISAFDPKTETALEAAALKRLEEKRRQLGK